MKRGTMIDALIVSIFIFTICWALGLFGPHTVVHYSGGSQRQDLAVERMQKAYKKTLVDK